MMDVGYYETLYLTRPDLTEDELNKVQGRLKEAISNHEGEIFKSQKWADRSLAYRIGKYNKGTYHILVYKSLRSAVSEVEKNLSRVLMREVYNNGKREHKGKKVLCKKEGLQILRRSDRD